MTQAMLASQRAGTRDQRQADQPVVYVVEDDPGTLVLLVELAAEAGFRPVAFTRLTAARRAVREQEPSLILLDDDLPDGRGADLVRELRTDPRTHNLPILFCTAADSTRRREIAALAPVIVKPFDVSSLERELSRLRPVWT
jgi:putative two-component system response regulator